MKKHSLISLICTSLITVGLCISPSGADTTAQITELRNEISNLKSAMIQLQSELPASYNRLHDLMGQANPSGGVLMVAPFVQVKRGATVDFPISLVPGTLSPSGLQADLQIPTGWTLLGIAAGKSTTDAGKGIKTNGGRFIIFGLSQTVLGPGVVAIATYSVPASAFANTIAISIDNPVASDANGSGIIIATVSGNVKVTQ